MLALIERQAPAFVPRALEYGRQAAEMAAEAVFLRQEGGPIPRPQRYEDLAKKYGTVVWVYAAVARKGRDVSGVPVRTIKRTQNGVTDVPGSHPLAALLRLVNPFLTCADLLEATSANLDLCGNAYWLKFVDRREVVRELWPIRPDTMTILGSPADFIAGYRVRAGNRDFDFAADQVVHFREFNPFSDYYGLGALTPVWNSAVIEEESAIWNRNILRNAGRLDGMLITEQPITKPQAQESADRFREMFAGPTRAGRVMVLGKGLKYESIATTPKELDFVLSRKLTREEILAAIGVRPVILGLETGDIGRRSEQIRDYYYATIRQRLGKILGCVNEFLVPDFDEPGLEVMADIEAALLPYEDRAALAQADSSDVAARIMLPNEIRRRRGLPPYEGGDEPLVSISLVPQEQLGQALGFGQQQLSAKALVAAVLTALRPELERAGVRAPLALARDTEAERAALWEAFVEKAAPLERGWETDVRRAFAAASEAMQSAITGGLTSATAVTQGLMETLRPLLTALATQRLPSVLEAGFTRAVGLVNAALAARERSKAPRVSIAFDLAIPRLAQYLAARPYQYATGISERLATDFRGLLAELGNQGASVAVMAQAVAERFDTITQQRALLIARTEIVAGANLSTRTAYEESGVVAKQEWLASRDARVRESHREADGQTVALSESFTVGGTSLRFPGDPQAPPAETVQCRCTTVPVVKED